MKRATLSWLGVATFLLGVSPGVAQEQSTKPALLATGTGHTNRIYCGVFTPDSRTFLSAGIDKEIRAWNVADGKPIYSLKGHGAPVRALGLAAGKLLISASADGSIYLWDLAGRKKVGELAKQKHNVDSLAVSPDGKTLATSTGAWNKSLPGDLRLWDLRSRKEIGALPHPQPVLAAAFSPDNRLLAAVDHTGAIKVWDVKTRKPVVTLFQDPACGSVEFSPDGKLLATGDFTGRVTLWDTGTWCEEAIVKAYNRPAYIVRFSPRGNMLASVTWLGGVKLWNPLSLEEQPPLDVPFHKSKFWFAGFSPDGKILATAGDDTLVRFWSITPDIERRFQAPAKPEAPKIVTRSGPAKIALLTSMDVDAARNVQDLALVQLTGDKGLILLERAEVERLLREHKLSLSGLVDANTAVKAGKILAVDLLAVIDYSSAAKQNSGAVVFDTVTGVRLADIGFPRPDLDEQARETAAGVRSALAKWRAGTKNLKTVCFLPVRNADLPRHMDGFCETLSAMLERRLLHHPAITALERKRLEGVTKEKALSQEAGTRELLASVLLVELEIGRARKSDGIRATVLIRDSSGKELHKIAHEVADPNGANLLEPLLARVQEALKTVQGQGGAQRNREARRFLREAKMLWKHHHYTQALGAAEAAFALRPNDDARLLLAEYLMHYAHETLKPGVLAATRLSYEPFDASPQKTRTVLGLMQRGCQLVDMAKPVTLDKGDDGGFWSLAENSDCYHANGRFLHALQYLRVQPADADAEEEIRAFRALSLRRHQERFQEFAGRVGPRGTERLTRAMSDRYEPEFGLIAPDPSAAAKAVRESLNIWLDLTRKLSADTFPTDSARLFGQGVLPYLYSPGILGKDYTRADRELSLPILKALEEHPYPVIRLHAARWHTKQLLKLGNVSLPEAEKRHRQLIEEAKGWIDKAPFKDPAPHRIAFYDFLVQALKDPPRSGDQKGLVRNSEDHFALAEFMLQRRDVVAGPWIEVAYATGFRKQDHARALELIARMRQMIDNSPHRLFFDPEKRIKRDLDRAQGFILKASPHLEKQRTLPWDNVITLAEAKAIPQAHVLMAPLREGRHVYLFAGSVEPGSKKPYLQLVRASLDGGKPQLLGKAFVTFKDLVGRDAKAPFNRLPRFVTECVIHRERLYAGTVGDGIYVFPLAGGDGVRIGEKEGLPAPAVVSLAALQDKLFAALEGGYLVMHDLETKRTDVIASSRRTEAQSPFDNAKPFRADTLLVDVPRKRVLFRMFQTSDKHPLSGMWEYSLKTRQFKKLLSLAFYKTSPVQDGKIILQWDTFSVVQRDGKPAWQKHEAFASFDLSTNKFTLFVGKSPQGMAEQTPAGIPAKLSAAIRIVPNGAANMLYHGGYLWLSWPFSRTPIKGGNKEILPHVRTPGTLQVQFNECLEAVSPNELLVGDWRALYLVRLKGLAPQ